MDKIKICIDHINEIFDTEDLATQIDFGTLHAVADKSECDLVGKIGRGILHDEVPLTMDHINLLYQL